MAAKKRGLGRGLDALLGGAKPVAADAGAPAAADDGDALRNVPLDLIQRGKYQPRIDMHQDSLQELAESIKAQGVVQPIVIRPIGDGSRYEIIAGERRWRASQLAGLHEIPAVVRDVPDQAAIAMALIENIQREDLNPIEEARALQRLIEEFELTHQEAAEAVGRSRAAVSNLLRLLELDPEVMVMLEHGDLEMGHGRALLALPRDRQKGAALKVAAQGMSVRETERFVKRLLAEEQGPARKPAPDPDIQRLEQRLSERLAAAVKIQCNARGKGKLTIHYNNLDELDGILAHIEGARDID